MTSATKLNLSSFFLGAATDDIAVCGDEDDPGLLALATPMAITGMLPVPMLGCAA